MPSRPRRRVRTLAALVAPVVVAVAFLTAASTPASARTSTAPTSTPVAPQRDGRSADPVRAAAERLLGKAVANRFRFSLEQPTAPGVDHYRIRRDRGHIAISGTTPAVTLKGLGAYLQEFAGLNISLTGETLGNPSRFPLPDREVVQKANGANRFAFNDTDDGYTGPYRTWDDWQRTIDVLALQGINQVFMPVGAEAVYLDTFTKFGYSREEMLRWITQPGHQPWWLLQNMSSFPSPMTEEVVAARAELGKRIVSRLDELGMTAVLPGYFGTVPPDFVAKNPGAKVVPQGDWVGFTRPDWLDPTNPVFAKVAAEFYAASRTRVGASTMYKMDLLHEGGRAGDVNVGAASKAVQASLESARPGAIWVLLGWQNNPLRATLQAVDRSKLFIVDGLADRYDNLDRESQWLGTSYAFGSIWNFGGHTTMGANMGVWNERYWQWKAKSNSAVDGIAVLPEASDNNPVAWDFLASLAWRDGPVDMSEWYAAWSSRRYGGEDAAAKEAWQILGRTAYDTPSGTWSESQDGLFGAQPSLTATKAATWSPGSMRYDATEFAKALPALLAVNPKLRDSSAYRYDLMDVSRQVLSNRSRTMLPQIKAAYDAKDLTRFRDLTGQWMDAMALLDKVTGTNEETMLGPWLAETAQWTSDPQQRARLREDARLLISVWGTRAGVNAGLGDYANREWNGLISTYYMPRWQRYFDELEAALVENRAPKPIDWFAVGDDWAREKTELPALATEPTGDIVRIAQEVVAWFEANSDAAKVTTDSGAGLLSRTTPLPVTVSITNPNAFVDLADVTLSVDVSGGLSATVTTRPATTLAGAATTTARAEITQSGDLPGTPTATAVVTYTAGGETREVRTPIKVVGPPPAGTTYLSDLPFLSSVGGHGPWERDMHNGETAAGDGGPLAIAGTTYAKGLGSNSQAQAVFHLGGSCTRLTAVLGIDDTMDKPGAQPDVEFRVLRDGDQAYASGVVRAGDARRLDLDVTGTQQLTLVVDMADGNNWWDRANWADAKVTCA